MIKNIVYAEKKWKAYFCLLALYNIQKKYRKTPLKSHGLLIFCFVKPDVLLIVNKEMLCKGISQKIGDSLMDFFSNSISYQHSLAFSITPTWKVAKSWKSVLTFCDFAVLKEVHCNNTRNSGILA